MAAPNKGRHRGIKRSKSYFRKCASGKRARWETKLDVGMKGILITCNRDEKQCTHEAYNILMEYADEMYGTELDAGQNDDIDSDEGDIADALQREVSQMNQQRSEKNFRFQAVDSRAKNVIFIRTKIKDEPTNLVHHILTKLKELGMCQSKHIQRMLPISGTCRASLEEIEKAIKPLLQPYFHSPEAKESKFAILFKARNNNQIHKGEVITVVANAVTSNSTCTHKVDLDDPDYSILVEVICNVCCLSVLKDYNKLKKYNIRAIVGDEPNQVRTNKERYESKGEESHKEERKLDEISSEPSFEAETVTDEQDEHKKQEKVENLGSADEDGVRTVTERKETEPNVLEKEKSADLIEAGGTETGEDSKEEKAPDEDGIRIF